MLTAATVLLVVMLILSTVTLFAFSWSAWRGQFEQPDRAARTIFDASEPVGKPTDTTLTHRDHDNRPS